MCAFTGAMEVRYGANGAFFFRTFTDGTACTNEVFGDPTPDVAKSCALRTVVQDTAIDLGTLGGTQSEAGQFPSPLLSQPRNKGLECGRLGRRQPNTGDCARPAFW